MSKVERIRRLDRWAETAMRELMELVCPCGTPMRERDDDSDPICKLGKPITRAEHLHRKGEK